MLKFQCSGFRKDINMSDIILDQIDRLNIKILDDPKNTDLLHSRAQLYTKTQNQSKAINDYLTILNLNPKDDIAKVKLDMLKTIIKFTNTDIYANPNTNLDPWME